MAKLIIIGFLTLFFTHSSSFAQEITALSKKEAVTTLLAKDKTRTWKMVERYDPYNGGVRTKIDTNLVQNVLIFTKKGTFEEIEQEGSKFLTQSSGKYFISTDKKMMALSYQKHQGNKIPKQSQEIVYDYQIKTLSDKEMILMRQGRHGFVEIKYVLVRVKK